MPSRSPPPEAAPSPKLQEAGTEAANRGGADAEDLDTLASSAWQLCSLDASVFALSFVYELFPTPVSGLLCWAIEGIQSAKNRGLMYSAASLLHPFNVPLLLDLCWTGGPWVLLLLWLFARPEQLSSEVVVIPFMMLLWRATCVGVKYAYFSRMDMLKLRSSSTWRKSMYNFRVLGTGQHFDTLGTICYDWLEELLNSALRCGILKEAAGCFVCLPPVAAQMVWTEVKTLLMSIDDPRSIKLRALFPGASSLARQGRYVDVQKRLGLSDLDAVEAEVTEGRLPVTALAYYLVSTSCRATSKPIFFIAAVFGVGCGFVYPAANKLTGHAAFGEGSAEYYFLAIRTWVMGMVFTPSLMFCLFPILDALKRMRLLSALLLVCGDPVLRSEVPLAHPLLKIKLSLNSVDDLKAIWVLSQLLGPMYGRGQSLRYGSAILSLSSTVVVCLTAAMYYYVHILEHTVSVGIAAEVLVFFLSGLFSIVVTATVCTRVSAILGHFRQILNRATAAFAFGSGCDTGGDEFLAAAEWVDLSIQSHLESYPVMVAYQPASTAVLSLAWSFSTVLIGMWLVVFQQTDFTVPFFEE